jgi:hypothetical protein
MRRFGLFVVLLALGCGDDTASGSGADGGTSGPGASDSGDPIERMDAAAAAELDAAPAADLDAAPATDSGTAADAGSGPAAAGTMLTMRMAVKQIVVYGDDLYFPAGNGLHRMKKDGSTEPAMFQMAIGANLFNSIAVDSSGVYFTLQDVGTTTHGSVAMCPLAGCTDPLTEFAAMQQLPTAISVDDDNLYWANQGNAALLNAPKSKATGPGAFDLGAGAPGATMLADPNGIATDADNIYWTAQGIVSMGGVYALARSGGSPVVVIESMIVAADIAIDDDHVFWTGSETGQADKDGSNKLVLGPAGAGIVTDGVNVYWTGGQFIYKCAVGGCDEQPTVLASAQAAQAIAMDDDHVYWSDVAVGIFRIAK